MRLHGVAVAFSFGTSDFYFCLLLFDIWVNNDWDWSCF